MSLRIARYVIAVCDRCGPGWWAADPACGRVQPHFLSQVAAREQLAAGYGWVISWRLLREPAMICRRCSRQVPAEPAGWRDRLETWLGRVPGAVSPDGAEMTEVTGPVPPGHPEAGSGVLTAEQEQMLAELDASLSADDPQDRP